MRSPASNIGTQAELRFGPAYSVGSTNNQFTLVTPDGKKQASGYWDYNQANPSAPNLGILYLSDTSIQADTTAIATAKANLKSTIATDKRSAADTRAADRAAVATARARLAQDKGNPGAMAADKSVLATAVQTLRSNAAAARSKLKADVATGVASIKSLTAQLKADERQLKADKKARL